MYRITRSHWRRSAALALAIAGFFLLYETRMLDSRSVADLLLSEAMEPAPGARLQFRATAYCKGTTTASGVRVRSGIAASDPAILPVGSVVDVETGDAKYDGIYTVMDTGPAVQGRILDLYIWSCHEALRFGRRPVRVQILRLGWSPSASARSLVDRLFHRRKAQRAAVPASTPAGTAPGTGDVPSAGASPAPSSETPPITAAGL